ncbi:MAG: aryl-sulfate sulfotransferase, partial [Candidatus Thorarchaeota archaeon]
FDNDFHNQTDPTSQSSRILEIKINETTMTANESWSWTSSSAYYSYYWGDADRLPNMNRLGTFGTLRHAGDPDMGARLVEVNNSGDIVWEMNFPSENGYDYGTIRCERFRFQPTLSSPNDFNATQNENVTVSWNAWYNYRPKQSVEGTFNLYLDDVSADSGSVFFDKLWRPVDLSMNLGILALGKHNVTLVVYDELGNYTLDTVLFEVLPFYIDREGPLYLEQGQESGTLTWFGGTSSPLNCSIEIDSTTTQSFVWDGENITIGLGNLAVGSHYVEFLLTNLTTQVYSEGFWITIYPKEAPIISSHQSGTEVIRWNETLIASWTLADWSPNNWSIFINESLRAENVWKNPNYDLDWTVPVLDEGVYNISLIAADALGHRTTDSFFLHVISPRPPIIESKPTNIRIAWGADNVVLYWKVHGGDTWKLWRNNSLLEEGIITGLEIQRNITKWHEENWKPGFYNLTLEVEDDASSIVGGSIIELYLSLGDPYANSVIDSYSGWYLFGDNALGAPDGEYATIYLDYGNGFMLLDMGEGEDIINGNGTDFEIIATGGNYSVSIGTSISSTFYSLGRGHGNSSYDLDTFGVESIRYVRIEYYNGDSIELDAIVAHNYLSPEDNEAPTITDLSDFWIWENQTTTILTWNVNDATPWSYVVFVNQSQSVTDYWNEFQISFAFTPQSIGFWNITLVLYDIYDNSAYDSVIVEVREVIVNITTTLSAPTQPAPDWFQPVVLSGSVIMSVITIGLVYYTKFRTKKISS